jgi:hypothetical protein
MQEIYYLLNLMTLLSMRVVHCTFFGILALHRITLLVTRIKSLFVAIYGNDCTYTPLHSFPWEASPCSQCRNYEHYFGRCLTSTWLSILPFSGLAQYNQGFPCKTTAPEHLHLRLIRPIVIAWAGYIEASTQ